MDAIQTKKDEEGSPALERAVAEATGGLNRFMGPQPRTSPFRIL